MELLTVGEAFQDIIFAGLSRLPRPGEELRAPTFTTSAGGGALITACAAARLGLTVGTITAMEKSVAAELRRERIKVINLQRAGERGAVSASLSMPHERAFVTYDGVNALLEKRLLLHFRGRVPRARHVHFALSPQNCRAWLPVVQRLRQQGASTSWDFGWNEGLLKDRSLGALMNRVSWLFLNEQEARLYSGAGSARAARAYWSARPGGTVIKRGANGAIVLAGAAMLSRKSVRARVIDTTGAGDAFNGAFLAALLRGAPASEALRLATYVGARSTEALGGLAGLPPVSTLPLFARQLLEAR